MTAARARVCSPTLDDRAPGPAGVRVGLCAQVVRQQPDLHLALPPGHGRHAPGAAAHALSRAQTRHAARGVVSTSHGPSACGVSDELASAACLFGPTCSLHACRPNLHRHTYVRVLRVWTQAHLQVCPALRPGGVRGGAGEPDHAVPHRGRRRPGPAERGHELGRRLCHLPVRGPRLPGLACTCACLPASMPRLPGRAQAACRN